MKLLLCFALGSLAFLVTNGKKINIQIESDDLINMIEGVMYSEVLQKFASQLVQRSSLKRTLNNPYHPEDDLLSSLDTDDKNSKHVRSTTKLDVTTDSLEKQNDQFLNGNDILSDDILTDAADMLSINELAEKQKLKMMTLNSTRNSTDEHIEMKKRNDNAANNNSMSSKKIDDAVNNKNMSFIKDGMRIFGGDRAYFKPIQRRFVLKGSNDTPPPTLLL